MMTPAAVVYVLKDDAFVRTASDSLGLLREEGPVERVRGAILNAQRLGEAVLTALGRSRAGAPRSIGVDENAWKAHLDEIGMKTWNKFNGAARMISVWTVDARLHVSLWGKVDGRGGRSGSGQKAVLVELPGTSDSIGRAIVEVLRAD